MAHLRRLMFFVLGFLLSAVPMLAFADEYTPAYTYAHRVNSADVVPGIHATQQAACEASQYTGANSYSWSAGQAVCRFSVNGGSTWINWYTPVGGYWCAYGGTYNRSTGKCENAPVCESGQRDPATGQCKTPEQTCTESGGHWGVNTSLGDTFEVSYACYPAEPQCMEQGGLLRFGYAYNLDARCGTYNDTCPSDMSNIVNPILAADGSCWFGGTPPPPEPDPEPDPEPEPPPKCGAGQTMGTVDGITVCANVAPTEKTDVKTTTKTNSDGSTTTTTTTTNTTVNTTTNKTTTTTTTTTTTRDPAGNVTGESTTAETKEQDSGGFCEENPDAEVCGGGGDTAWTGGCDDPAKIIYQCEGDPVDCAIAEQTLRTRCALHASNEILEKFSEMVQFDGTAPGEGLDRKQIDVPEVLDVAMQGGGSGLSDQTFVIMGNSITIPFSQLNRFIEMLGYAIMMVAWIQAYRIVAGVM